MVSIFLTAAQLEEHQKFMASLQGQSHEVLLFEIECLHKCLIHCQSVSDRIVDKVDEFICNLSRFDKA